jgi:DNA-binding NarL/FixJ family response regulator
VIRLAIADAHTLVRAGVHALLAAQEDITVVGGASDSDEAVALAQRLRPDLMLMDVALPGIGGLEATRRIVFDLQLVATKVIVLATSERDDHLLGALRAGASSFMVKDTHPAQLLEVVRAVAAGEALLSRTATRRLILEIASQSAPTAELPARFEELTAREREVVALVATGLSNQEIADRLVVSPATAKTHVSRALRKARARDRAHLVALAYESGLVQPQTRALRPVPPRIGKILTSG